MTVMPITKHLVISTCSLVLAAAAVATTALVVSEPDPDPIVVTEYRTRVVERKVPHPVEVPKVVTKTEYVEVIRDVPSTGVIDLHDGSGISYGWSRENAERKLTDLLGCDAKAPAAMDDWGDTVWFAYCEPALAEVDQ